MTVHRPLPTDPQTACKILLDCYNDAAGTEALLRAFLAERDRDRPKAEFWIEVYGLVAERDGHRADQPKA
jgi:hypothetical protein